MIADEPSLALINQFYKSFEEAPESINEYYLNGSLLSFTFLESNPIMVRGDYHQVVLKGIRKYVRCSALLFQNQTMAHATGFFEFEKVFYQISEQFVFTNQSEKPFILSHSVFVSPIEGGWCPPVPKEEKPVQKVEEKPVKAPPKEPIEVKSPSEMIYTRSIVATNLPHQYDQKTILPEFSCYGAISKFSIAKGQVAIEFENPTVAMNVIQEGNFQWYRRTIKVKGMPQGFSFS